MSQVLNFFPNGNIEAAFFGSKPLGKAQQAAALAPPCNQKGTGESEKGGRFGLKERDLDRGDNGIVRTERGFVLHGRGVVLWKRKRPTDRFSRQAKW